MTTTDTTLGGRDSTCCERAGDAGHVAKVVARWENTRSSAMRRPPSSRSDVTELRDLVRESHASRVHAQFTTISAHAEIAREQFEFAREEAHADLERTREMLIDWSSGHGRDLSDSEGCPHARARPPAPSVVVQRPTAQRRRVTRSTRRSPRRSNVASSASRCSPTRWRRLIDTVMCGTARRARRRPQPRLSDALSARARSGSRRRPIRDPSAGGRSPDRMPGAPSTASPPPRTCARCRRPAAGLG